jgi:outer membrane protein TolC
MKKISALTVFLFSFIFLQVSAQETILTDINYGQLEKYIQLAKESYPKRKVATAQMESAKINIPLAKVQYLEIFNASYFYRPEKQDVVNINNPYTVNGFQFGININLGSFLQKPYLVKKAKADYKVAQLQSQDFDLFLENEVKRRYYNYLMTSSQLKIRTETAQDNKNISEVTRHKFEKGELPLDVYNASRILVSSSNNDKIQYEVNYLLAKDALEEIIGQKLTDVK